MASLRRSETHVVGMRNSAYLPYSTLGTLKAFAEEVWIVDGPEIGMRCFGAEIPFPTRMTLVRLRSGDLWIHSPIAWNAKLASEVAALGRVGYLVAPNTLHYWYLPDWQAHVPNARSYGPPSLRRKARRPVTLDETLTDAAPAAWAGDLEQRLVVGNIVTEAVFFHRASRTLILTDLIENFEPARIRSPLLRWLVTLAGATDPDGKAPIDLQLSFLGKRRQMRAAVEQMIAWRPERIVLAHGRCYGADAVAELRRAFRWVL